MPSLFCPPQRLVEMDVEIVEEDPTTGKDYSKIGGGDVVIFPAFGATVQVGPCCTRARTNAHMELTGQSCNWTGGGGTSKVAVFPAFGDTARSCQLHMRPQSHVVYVVLVALTHGT